jgi:ABC-type Zn uptake system ZnuABC Zn-binding protein ZnuA
MFKLPTIVLIGVLVLSVDTGATTLKVVTTLPSYGSIAKYIGGDRVEVYSISRGDQDAHFVKPKPSFALLLKDADLFVTTGLDLELWAPVLVDKSGNRQIRDGQKGFVSASQGVPLLDVPATADRSAGDVHIYGNPHIFTGPLNAKIVAANIAAGLTRIDPDGAESYSSQLDAFQLEIDNRVFGPVLVEIFGGDVLDDLVRQGRLVSFLGEQTLEGRPLLDELGGWMGQTLPHHGASIVTYHKNWIYFADTFDFEVVDYVEPKPGIPPSAKHVHRLIEEIKEQQIQVVLAANYFSRQQVEAIADRTGCASIRVPMGPSTVEAESYFDLVDLWVSELTSALDRTEEN